MAITRPICPAANPCGQEHCQQTPVNDWELMSFAPQPTYSRSNPWSSNFSVRLFSVTVRTYVLRHTRRYFSFDFQRHLHPGADQPGEVRNHFVGDAAGVATDTCGIEGDTAKKAFGQHLRCWRCCRSTRHTRCRHRARGRNRRTSNGFRPRGHRRGVALRRELNPGYIGLDQQSGSVRIHDRDLTPGLQTAISSCRSVVAVSEGE